MADITVTAAQVRRVYPDRDECYTFIAGAAITAGAAVYMDTTLGTLKLADGSATGTAQVVGIALEAAAIGEPVAVLVRGFLAGFTLAGDYFSRVYLSNTDAGILGDAAGAVSVVVGRVMAAADNTPTKLLFVQTNYLAQYT